MEKHTFVVYPDQLVDTEVGQFAHIGQYKYQVMEYEVPFVAVTQSEVALNVDSLYVALRESTADGEYLGWVKQVTVMQDADSSYHMSALYVRVGPELRDYIEEQHNSTVSWVEKVRDSLELHRKVQDLSQKIVYTDITGGLPEVPVDPEVIRTIKADMKDTIYGFARPEVIRSVLYADMLRKAQEEMVLDRMFPPYSDFEGLPMPTGTAEFSRQWVRPEVIRPVLYADMLRKAQEEVVPDRMFPPYSDFEGFPMPTGTAEFFRQWVRDLYPSKPDYMSYHGALIFYEAQIGTMLYTEAMKLVSAFNKFITALGMGPMPMRSSSLNKIVAVAIDECREAYAREEDLKEIDKILERLRPLKDVMSVTTKILERLRLSKDVMSETTINRVNCYQVMIRVREDFLKTRNGTEFWLDNCQLTQEDFVLSVERAKELKLIHAYRVVLPVLGDECPYARTGTREDPMVLVHLALGCLRKFHEALDTPHGHGYVTEHLACIRNCFLESWYGEYLHTLVSHFDAGDVENMQEAAEFHGLEKSYEIMFHWSGPMNQAQEAGYILASFQQILDKVPKEATELEYMDACVNFQKSMLGQRLRTINPDHEAQVKLCMMAAEVGFVEAYKVVSEWDFERGGPLYVTRGLKDESDKETQEP